MFYIKVYNLSAKAAFRLLGGLHVLYSSVQHFSSSAASVTTILKERPECHAFRI